MQNLENSAKAGPFVILAPEEAKVPDVFQGASRDAGTHERLLSEMQVMRGSVALQEGAIRSSDLDEHGRHQMPGDRNSWHLLRVGEDNRIRGCARILVHHNRACFSTLRLAASALARSSHWKRQVRFAVEAEIAVARMSDVMLIEPGGWVLDEKLRGSQEAVSIALSAFAWSQLVGDCLAYVTATVKHGSSSILRRLGGKAVRFAGTDIPRYYDPAYDCEMELLRLETKGLNPRFEPMMEGLRGMLSMAKVLQAGHEPLVLDRLAA